MFQDIDRHRWLRPRKLRQCYERWCCSTRCSYRRICYDTKIGFGKRAKIYYYKRFITNMSIYLETYATEPGLYNLLLTILSIAPPVLPIRKQPGLIPPTVAGPECVKQDKLNNLLIYWMYWTVFLLALISKAFNFVQLPMMVTSFSLAAKISFLVRFSGIPSAMMAMVLIQGNLMASNVTS